MGIALRSRVAAGVALAVAGTVAVTPLTSTPTPTPVAIASPAVQLTTTLSPFVYYPNVVLRSLANTGERFEQYLEDPLPIARAIVGNQVGAISDIVSAIGSHNPGAILAAVANAIVRPVVNLIKLGGGLIDAAGSTVLRLTVPVLSALTAAANAVGDVVKAAFHLDLLGVVNAVVNVPAQFIDGLLNGGTLGNGQDGVGILTNTISAPGIRYFSGPIDGLIEKLQDIGAALSGSAAPDAGATPSAVAGLEAPSAVAPRPSHALTARTEIEKGAATKDSEVDPAILEQRTEALTGPRSSSAAQDTDAVTTRKGPRKPKHANADQDAATAATGSTVKGADGRADASAGGTTKSSHPGPKRSRESATSVSGTADRGAD